MNWVSGLRTALLAIRGNLLRSLLTMLGIVIGVAAVTTVVSVGEGARQEVIVRLQSIGANLLLVLPGTPNERGLRLQSGTRPTLTLRDAESIEREIGGLAAVAPSVFKRMQVVFGNRNWSAVVQGVTVDYLVAREWPVATGRSFTPSEIKRVGKVALIGQTLLINLFGNTDPIGRVIRVNDVPLTVVGTLGKKGLGSGGADQDDRILVPLSTAQIRLLGTGSGGRNVVQYIMLKSVSADRLPAIQDDVTALLRQRHSIPSGEPDDFEVRNLSELMAARERASAVFGKALLAVALISLIVGGISIMNIMLMSVAERTREIGLRMAIGARRCDIRRQFLIETLIICLVAGLIGACLGVGGSYAVAAIAGWPVIVSVEAVLLGFLSAAGTGLVFGLYPAQKAARLEPIEALRYE